MKKKICPRPQCEKEYLESEGFDNLTACIICGAPLEEVFVEDYDIEENNEFEEDIEYENDICVYEEERICEDDIDDINEVEDNENSFEERNCFVDIEVVDHSFKNEVIISSEGIELAENDFDYTENDEEDESDKEDNIEVFNEEESSSNDEVNPYENIKGNNFILYKDNKIFKVYELKYDEIIIGRNSSEFTPDIDLQEVDKENATSRKHLLVYKEDDKYYIRNLSKKCSVHIKRYEDNEARVVAFNESVIIEDGDFVVLSGEFILEAFFGEVEE